MSIKAQYTEFRENLINEIRIRTQRNTASLSFQQAKRCKQSRIFYNFSPKIVK